MSKDDTLFKNLYDRYSEDVYRFSFWLGGDPELAKDVTSETFVRLWTSDSDIRFETVKAYLFAIARNLILQHRRREKKRTSLDKNLVDNAVRPDEKSEQRSELERTLKALETLPEIDRTVLIMRAEDELSSAEISIATGLTVSAVKVKIFRARLKLQEMINSKKGWRQ